MPARKRSAAIKLHGPPKKRSAPAVEEATNERRRSRRISTTVTKSAYFEEEEDEDDGDEDVDIVTAKRKLGKGVTKGKTANKRGRKSATKVEDSEDEYEENGQDGQVDDEDNGVEELDEYDDEDGDTQVRVVKIAPMRPEGGTPYSDETVHKNTLLFLKDLKANNKRSWLKSNDREYRRALKDWESFVVTLTGKLSEVDFTIPDLPPRDVIFRIYRDTRFSKDPTPYKPHFSAAWSRTGRKGPYACYYVHAEPGSCFVGGGLWHPENEAVHKLRASIDERPRRWRRVLNDAALKRTFLPTAAKSDNPEVALKAFSERNQENALKTRPKGFNPEHRDLMLLKLRNFTLSKKVVDNVIFGPRAQDEIASIFRDLAGFVTFLNSVVMPDPNLTDDESDEDEGSGEGSEEDDGEEDE